MVMVSLIAAPGIRGWAAPPAEGGELRGKVIGVLDGDTIQVLVPLPSTQITASSPQKSSQQKTSSPQKSSLEKTVRQQTVTIRLEGIDAPESEQRFGKQAKQALAQRVAGKVVVVQIRGTDKFERTLGVVRLDGDNVNLKQVEEGWAWHFTRFSDDEQLARSEQAARRAKRGLWADERPIAPWTYRDEQIQLKSAATAARNPASSDKTSGRFWLNEISGVRHNESCEHFKKTARGRPCGPGEGKACGLCGG